MTQVVKDFLVVNEYCTDTESLTEASRYLNMVKAPKNGAIVLDIDDTTLTVRGGVVLPMRGVQLLVEISRRRGFSLFFLTARPYSRDNVSYTHEHLRLCGYEQGSYTLMMRPARLKGPQFSLFKSMMRKLITCKLKKTILMSIGDNVFDLFDFETSDDKHLDVQRQIRTLDLRFSYHLEIPLSYTQYALKLIGNGV